MKYLRKDFCESKDKDNILTSCGAPARFFCQLLSCLIRLQIVINWFEMSSKSNSDPNLRTERICCVNWSLDWRCDGYGDAGECDDVKYLGWHWTRTLISLLARVHLALRCTRCIPNNDYVMIRTTPLGPPPLFYGIWRLIIPWRESDWAWRLVIGSSGFFAKLYMYPSVRTQFSVLYIRYWKILVFPTLTTYIFNFATYHLSDRDCERAFIRTVLALIWRFFSEFAQLDVFDWIGFLE